MKTNINENLKQSRKTLGLSQEFVSSQMNMHRTTIVAIESGNRKITSDELAKFSNLYGVSIDELMYGNYTEDLECKMFARTFAKLSEIDRKEIMNLIDFKRRYKEHNA